MGKTYQTKGDDFPPPRLISRGYYDYTCYTWGCSSYGSITRVIGVIYGYIMLYHEFQLKGWENSTMIPMTQLWYLPLPSRREIMNQRLGWVKLLQGHTSCGFPANDRPKICHFHSVTSSRKNLLGRLAIEVASHLLVGGWPTPPKNMKVSWDDYSQYMEK